MDDIATDRHCERTAAGPSDAEIVRRVLAGQRDEYALLVGRYLPMVERFWSGRGLRGAGLDEAVQNALVTAYQKLGRLRDPSRFGGYLLKIARYSAPRPRKPALPPTDVTEPAGPSHEEPWHETLEAAVARLPDSMQVVLALKYTDDLTAAEIARRLGQTVGSVTKTLSRAYQRLRADVELAQFARRGGQNEN